jgi:CRISPR-associated protein Cmr3
MKIVSEGMLTTTNLAFDVANINFITCSYLYQVQMIRMQPHYGFVVDIELGEERYWDSELPHPEQRRGGLGTPPELAFLKEGWLTLGSEQLATRFEVLQPESIAEEQGISQRIPGRLLYFATPAYSKNGWLPATPGILPAEPITTAINRYQPIVGWLLNPGNAGGEQNHTSLHPSRQRLLF